jgi:2-oxoglutarate ferredoxin oxidoreductase subunit alpha
MLARHAPGPRLQWNFQVPAFILADKTVSESVYSIDPSIRPASMVECLRNRNDMGEYQRYRDTESGVSPLAFPGAKGAVVKVNGYAHDTSGITTEESDIVDRMTEKRLRKGKSLAAALAEFETVTREGVPDADTALICWGSVRGVCIESCKDLGLRMVQPVVLEPFPVDKLNEALKDVRHTVVVEENATGQLSALLRLAGIPVDREIRRYDGRPFTPSQLVQKLREVI